VGIEELRYLGVVMKRSRVFKCSLDYAKKGFYRAANAILGKLGVSHPRKWYFTTDN